MAERGQIDQASPAGKVEADVLLNEPRSFRMDRRSPEAAALRDVVSRKLLDFLGAYSDDVLTEYIIVLVCNGKHQNQARDELEAFLGNESENFVTWLWNYLSLQTNVSNTPVHCLDETAKSKGGFSDPSNDKESLSHANNIDDVERPKGWRPSEIASIKVHADRPQEQTHAINNFSCLDDINQTQNGFTMFVDASLISSTKFFSGGEHCLERQNQHWKITKNSSSASPSQPLHMPKTETVMRNSQPIEDIKHEFLSYRNTVPSEPSANDVAAIEAQITRPRGNVWDRLGKQCKENESLLRGERHYITTTEKLNLHTEESQDSKLVVVEPYATYSGNKTENSAVFDKGHKRRLAANSSQRQDVQEYNKHYAFEPVDKSRKIRQGDITSGNMYASFAGSEESLLQTKEALQEEPTCTSASSLNEKNKQSDKVIQSASKKNTSETTMAQNSVPYSLTSDKPEPLKFTNRNSESRPIHNEITDVKLKLQQVEKDMQKLRAKQADLNNSKSKLPAGQHHNTKEDFEPRTVVVSNVHFAASREALFSHFTKCGAIVKVTLLTDALTNHPKGEAHIVFANKESIDKAISLTGTSFFSRILTVSRKTEMASGSVPTQPAMKAPQSCYPLSQKGTFQRHNTHSHFQWKRE
ncbi:uncharacterized protein LOC122008869 isoform X2 [Zingiber officinale]|uniref:uncharacterized protein LOC122008869 isoform X2 n=1 Tax=Zingiber officinale TaxID=94328 RepID=UPI001C4BA89C|nr:uncharacterized protein LOC122008869 isoform X2 [Zingiber officinale]